MKTLAGISVLCPSAGCTQTPDNAFSSGPLDAGLVGCLLLGLLHQGYRAMVC